MIPLPPNNNPSGILRSDQLYRLQLRIARRADALARSSPNSGPDPRHDRETWQRAESELLQGTAIAGDLVEQPTR